MRGDTQKRVTGMRGGTDADALGARDDDREVKGGVPWLR
jgi:hypothetical protein